MTPALPVVNKAATKNKSYNREMLGFGSAMSDQQIVDLLSFIRQSWGNSSTPVVAHTVSEIRAATSDRIGYWTIEELLQEEP